LASVGYASADRRGVCGPEVRGLALHVDVAGGGAAAHVGPGRPHEDLDLFVRTDDHGVLSGVSIALVLGRRLAVPLQHAHLIEMDVDRVQP